MRTVRFNFSRNASPGDVTRSMRLVITDSSNNIIITQDLAEWVTSWASDLPEGIGYTIILTAYSGQLHTGLPCLNPPFRVFDVPPLPQPQIPGNPTLEVPIII